MRVALLSDTETLSSCWTWYGIDFFCNFNLTEQWESPCYQTIKQYQVAGLGIVPCYQTLKQYQVAGLGMLLIIIFLFFCHPTIRVAVLLKLKQYLVAGLGMVLIFFCIFNLTEQWESPCYQTLKQYEVAGLFMLLMFLFLFYHPTIKVAMLLIWNNIQLLDSVWYWYFFSFFVNPLSDSPCY